MGSASPFLDGSRGAHARAARNQRSQRARPRDEADTKGRCLSPEIAHQVQHPPKTSEAGPGESPRREGTQGLSPRAPGRRTTSPALAAPTGGGPQLSAFPPGRAPEAREGAPGASGPASRGDREDAAPGPSTACPAPQGPRRATRASSCLGLRLVPTQSSASHRGPALTLSQQEREQPVRTQPCLALRPGRRTTFPTRLQGRGAAVRVRSRESAGGRGDSSQRTVGTSSMAAQGWWGGILRSWEGSVTTLPRLPERSPSSLEPVGA